MAEAASPARAWASTTIWAGAIWIVLAMLPVPVTTLIGIPFAVYALLGGLAAASQGRAHADDLAVRRARWGMRLGCAGFVYLTLFYLIAGGVILAGLIAALNAALQGTP